MGSAAFRCLEQVTKDKHGSYLVVRLIGAEHDELEKVLLGFLKDDNGLLHVCEADPCSQCHKSSLHVQCAQVCTKREAERAARHDFEEFG